MDGNHSSKLLHVGFVFQHSTEQQGRVSSCPSTCWNHQKPSLCVIFGGYLFHLEGKPQGNPKSILGFRMPWAHTKVPRGSLLNSEAFLSIQGEAEAERAFGLASRHIASVAPWRLFLSAGQRPSSEDTKTRTRKRGRAFNLRTPRWWGRITFSCV